MKKVMVIYGGVSTEHEVAIITALQVMNGLKEAGHEVAPVYISKDGKWFLGDERYLKAESYKNLGELTSFGKELEGGTSRGGKFLQRSFWGWKEVDLGIEAIFPVFHGRNGEDGTMQGWLNLIDLPYVGCGIGASAVAMDKYLSKKVAAEIGLRVAKDVLALKSEWKKDKKSVMGQIEKLGKKVFIKPSGLGSSIGVTRAEGPKSVEEALEVAFVYDERVVVEEEIENPVEVNISILGNGPYELSITEQPIASSKVLSFEDKYLRGAKSSKAKGMASAQRLMPAGVGEKTIKEIEAAAVGFFRAVGGKGISRIDFMVDKNKKVFFNEINPMPGSIAFYLWEKKGVKISQLVDRLVKLAVEDWRERQKLVSTFESNILSGYAGSKGGGVKS
jgi:D-alanine-D-alanine ligase